LRGRGGYRAFVQKEGFEPFRGRDEKETSGEVVLSGDRVTAVTAGDRQRVVAVPSVWQECSR